MSSVPICGAYVSEDRSFRIDFKWARPEDGKIFAIYDTNRSQEGAWRCSGEIGSYAWVVSPRHPRYGQAPFAVRFIAGHQPEGEGFCFADNWSGVYRPDHTIILSGRRSYSDREGEVEVRSLGNMIFSRFFEYDPDATRPLQVDGMTSLHGEVKKTEAE